VDATLGFVRQSMRELVVARDGFDGFNLVCSAGAGERFGLLTL